MQSILWKALYKYTWLDLNLMSTSGKIGNYLECFPLVNNLPHCRTISSIVCKWLYNPSQIDGGHNCFSKIIADVFPPWNWVNTHLNALGQQTAQTSAIELITLADDQFIKDIWLAVPYGRNRGVLNLSPMDFPFWPSFC